MATKDVTPEKMVKILAKMRKKDLPNAVKATLNDTAFGVRQKIQKDLPSNFTIRNRFTERSIRVNKVVGNNIKTMFSEVGSVQEYMKTQEDGGVVRSRTSTLPIPTREARIGKSSKKMVARRFKLDRLGKGIFFGKFGKKGIFIQKKRGIRMLYSLDQAQVFIKPSKWLAPAVARRASESELSRRFVFQAKKILFKTIR